MLELKVEELQEIKPIGFNYEELKGNLAVSIEKYKGMVYTDDTISAAKNDRATLNKLSKALNDKRIELEKEYMKPFNVFKDKINELIAMIKEPTLLIDNQVKDYEDRKKDEKKSEIVSKFNEIVSENMKTVVKFDNIFNEKWLNATYKMTDIEKEITEYVENLEASFRIIEELKSEFELQLKDIYMRTGSLADVMKENNRLKDQKERIEAEKQAAAARKAQAEMFVEPNPIIPQEIIDAEEKAKEMEALEVIDFRVWVTEDQKELIKNFLLENKIKFGKVPTGEVE